MTGLAGTRWGRPLLWSVITLGVIWIVTVSLVAVTRSRSDRQAFGSGWVRVATLADAQTEGVVYVVSPDAFVVVNDGRPLALSAINPHLGERVLFCQMSGWFESLGDGSKIDRFGNYALGPSPRGLDRIAITILDGVVWIDPSTVTSGPARYAVTPAPPTGPEPGFASRRSDVAEPQGRCSRGRTLVNIWSRSRRNWAVPEGTRVTARTTADLRKRW